MSAGPTIPVVLTAYARPDHLARVLACLRANAVPLIHAYCDGAKGAADAAAVEQVRALLRAIDWADVRLTLRSENLGLGANVLAAVSAVAEQHPSFIVWEDDLIAVPGTYAWLCAALQHYANDERVMSVTAWTHPRVAPGSAQPYFDGRAECWVWGAWARSWRGMAETTAAREMERGVRRGVAADAYGTDLPAMAAVEARKNIWAVRWIYHHLAEGGLCLRPPRSLVEHIGFDAAATHAGSASGLTNPPLQPAPPLPKDWPEPVEAAGARERWRRADPARGLGGRVRLLWVRAKQRLRRGALTLGPVRHWRDRVARVRWEGDYPTWAEAEARAGGYDAPSILERVLVAARRARDGDAAYERDGVAFAASNVEAPVLDLLQAALARTPQRLVVVDFGGALGSLYWQHRAWLAGVPEVRWHVVEQLHFVAAGRREFANDQLRFFSTLDEACAGVAPAVLILRSVLPYLPEPYALLNEIAPRRVPAVLIDRTSIVDRPRDRITLQHVPARIYRATYPCRFFNRERLLAPFARDYALRAEYDTSDGAGEFRFKGFRLELVGPP
jgi:putative methyltransferase (TIGR04325 family)